MGYRQMKHELYVIGMGPGREEKMTLEALQALEACDTIVGYTVYVDLLKTRYSSRLTEVTSEKSRSPSLYRSTSFS